MMGSDCGVVDGVGNEWWRVGRRSQHTLLSGYCSGAAFSPHLRVLGVAAGGKTRLVMDVLRERRCRFAFIDCAQLTSTQHILASIHSQLHSQASAEAEGREEREGGEGEGEGRSAGAAGSKRRRGAGAGAGVGAGAGAPTFRDGVSDLAQAMVSSPDAARTSFIVLKQTQSCLSSAGVDVVSALLAVGEWSHRHISLILIDRAVSEERRADGSSGCVVDCLTVFFPPYSSEELAAIISQQLERSVVERFVSDAVAALILATRDLRELHRLIDLLWSRCAATASDARQRAVEGEEVSWGSSPYLLHRLKLQMQALFQSVYLQHEDGTSALSRAHRGDEEGAVTEAPAFLSSWLSPVQCCLLFAAFIASHNSRAQDQPLFGTQQAKRRRSRRQPSASLRAGRSRSAVAPTLQPPKPFTFDRIRAIARHIHTSHTPPTPHAHHTQRAQRGTAGAAGGGGGQLSVDAFDRSWGSEDELYAQFLSLIPLQLVDCIARPAMSASGGGGLELDGVLYRCAVSLSEASSLAQLWRFDLLSYLHHST